LQYYYDASEAEAWMSEQELYMMGDERAKDEIGAQNFMKKHQVLENAVEDYADVVRQLGEKSRTLIDSEHPERYLLLYMIIFDWFMVFKATFYNISVISWRSFFLVKETGENH
jgi:hypothetical protein